MKNKKRLFLISACLLTAFVIWTAAVLYIDVLPIGPSGSSVGFASLNQAFHRLTGVHLNLYILTDWLSLIPVGFAMGFAVLGLMQWIRRKSLLKVDRSILALGGFYTLVMAAYVFFEMHVVNYRPVLIDGYLEASYPSSTTLLVLCIMPTAILQLRSRIRQTMLRRCITLLLAAFTALMVLVRLISGVHWLSDIIGGVLLSAGLVTLYCAVVRKQNE